MNQPGMTDIRLVLDWHDTGAPAGLRRDTTGFNTIKSLAEQASSENPLTINAFLYAFLCPAKNLDLFLNADTDLIESSISSIERKLKMLEDFEREAVPVDAGLRKIYLAVRKVAARKNARDEQRAMATLLFSGPSTVGQIARDLGISENLVRRIMRTLRPLVEETVPDQFVLRKDTDALAVGLQLLRSTLGLDPVRVLRHIIDSRNQELSTCLHSKTC